MNNDRKEPWLTFLEHDCLFGTWHGSLQVIEVVVKVRHTGLLAVVKAQRDGEPLVAFKGARTLRALSGGIRDMLAGSGTRWRTDKFA